MFPKCKFSREFLHPRYWLTWFGLGVLWLWVQLPYPVLCFLGTRIGTMARPFLKRRESIARKNLELCFPQHSAKEREKMIAENFRSLGMALVSRILLLKKLQARSTRKTTDDRTFDEIERDLRLAENELKDIFERTYGTIKPRYVETEEDRRRYAKQDAERERQRAIAEGLIEPDEAPEVTLSTRKQSSKKDQRIAERQKEYLLVDG